MKFELFNEETNKVWKKVSTVAATNQLQLELDIYKKLLSFFQVGDYYYIIFDINALEFDFVSPHIETILGYDPTSFNMAFFMEIIHPDDRQHFLTFEAHAVDFYSTLPVEKLMKYKVRYDYRLKTKNGNYVHILHQSAVIEHDDHGLVTRILSVETDISYLKKGSKPVLSIIGMDGEPSYIDIAAKNFVMESDEVLTRREKQVLLLLIEGKLSKEIASSLNISKQTVDNHRKNMLRKTGVINTTELVGKAIRDGFI
jgi:DNA-binding CsgD family transcriptional regulator